MAVVIKKTGTIKPLESAYHSPMLAAEGVLGAIPYPIIAMPKLNGVRGLVQQGVMMPRSLKKMRNVFTAKRFGLPALSNMDGELVVGDFADEEVFVISTSGVGSVEGEPGVRWYVFDFFHPTLSYIHRLELRDRAIAEANHPHVIPVPWKMLTSDEELVAYSDWALSQGYEGLVLRDPKAKYKQGRSTAKEAGFMRYCAWLKSEARILEIHEGEVNNNPSVANELGFAKKSSHKANKVGSGMAGAFTVKDLKTGIEFNVPVPSVELQKAVWADKEGYIGRIVHYYFKPPVKIGGKPRFPQHKGFREAWDMS